MIGDCFTLVDRGECCALTRVAFDWVSPAPIALDQLGCHPLLGEVRLCRKGAGFTYHVLDVLDEGLTARPSSGTSLELWDRRHAVLLRAQADVSRMRQALDDLGLLAPYLTLRADSIAVPGRTSAPSMTRMDRLHEHWKGLPPQRPQ